jgi:putative membrane protein
LLKLYQSSPDVSFTSMGLAMIWAVVGLYLIVFAYKVGDRLRQWSLNTRHAVRSGSTLIPFAVLAVLLFLLGLLYGIDAATANPDNDLMLKSLLFMSGTMWMWVFAYFTYEVGMFITHFLSKGTLSYTFVVASVTVFAIGFILQGALDATQTFFGYNRYDQVVIVLEIVSGFLLAVFGGLLNTSLRAVDGEARKEVENVEPTETYE